MGRRKFFPTIGAYIKQTIRTCRLIQSYTKYRVYRACNCRGHTTDTKTWFDILLTAGWISINLRGLLI